MSGVNSHAPLGLEKRPSCKQRKQKYQSVCPEQKVDNVADNFDTEFKFKAIRHEIIDLG